MNASHTEKIRTIISTKLHRFLAGSFSVFFCGRTDRQTDSDTYGQTSLKQYCFTGLTAWRSVTQWLVTLYQAISIVFSSTGKQESSVNFEII